MIKNIFRIALYLRISKADGTQDTSRLEASEQEQTKPLVTTVEPTR